MPRSLRTQIGLIWTAANLGAGEWHARGTPPYPGKRLSGAGFRALVGQAGRVSDHG
jgi:hypothetical protein